MQAFFMRVDPPRWGQRLVVYHPPGREVVRGCVVYVHPLAEEMNKARRMAALQSRRLALSGFAVLQIDMLGCGDSAGDFGDATWTDWTEDVLLAARWLTGRHAAPVWFWGLRAGCLVASEAAQRWDGGASLLLWQPPVSGKLVLQQFLRLAAAAQILEGSAKSAGAAVRQALALGKPVEVAGYQVSPGLASGLEAATLRPGAVRNLWLEVSAQAQPALMPASNGAIENWRTQGALIISDVAPGPAFWQTVEIEDAPALIEATERLLQDA